MLFSRKFTTSSTEISMNVAAEVRTNSNVWESVPNQNGSRAVGVVSVPVVLINSLTDSSMTNLTNYSSSPLCLLEATDSRKEVIMTIQTINTLRSVFLNATTHLSENSAIVQKVINALITDVCIEVSQETKDAAIDAVRALEKIAELTAQVKTIAVNAAELETARKAVKAVRAKAKRLIARKNEQNRQAVSAQNRAARVWNSKETSIADAMKEELRTMLLVRKAVKSATTDSKAIKNTFKNAKKAFQVIAQAKEVAQLEQQIAALEAVVLAARLAA